MLIDLKIRDDILENFKDYEYWNCVDKTRIDFSKANNLVGDQQEAFIIYHILRQLTEHKDTGMSGLDIGCGQNIHFSCLGINDYFGTNHKIYGGAYNPQITSQAEDIHNKINPGTLSFIVASHILEHVDNPIVTFRNWLKLLKKDGIIIFIMPDYNFEKSVVSWDPTHKTFWSPEDFEKNCIIPNQDIIKVEEFNSLKNKFSMNFVGRRI